VTRSFRICPPLLLSVLLFTATGCATGGGGETTQDPSFFRMDIGAARATDFLTETLDILRRRQYLIFRTDPLPALLVETEWRNHTPFEDEEALGALEVRCRIIVRGRERAPTLSTRTWQGTYIMEVQVRKEFGVPWEDLPLTPQRTRVAREIGDEMKLALELTRK
jgi:hypothetical protein